MCVIKRGIKLYIIKYQFDRKKKRNQKDMGLRGKT
jgi:hypothetical protein